MSDQPLLLRICLLLALISVPLLGQTVAQARPEVFILGDMEKPTGNEALAATPGFFKDGMITLHGAGNEVVAFQILLQAQGDEEVLDVRVSDLKGPALIPARPNVQLFLAHYAKTDDASYSWGPGGGGALDWRGKAWPDALVPFTDPYGKTPDPVAVPFAIRPAQHRNQAVWVDVLIPKDAPAGEYKATVHLLQKDEVFKVLPLTLRVHPFSLPDETHVDAYGELYRETGVMFDSGVKFKLDPQRDWPVYKRYLQMAHAHRFLATHRAEDGPLPRTISGKPCDSSKDFWSKDWSLYTPYVKPVLDGSLFTPAEGYVGPAPGAPPFFFPAPFSEAFYGAKELGRHMEQHGGSIDPKQLEVWRDNAAAFWDEAKAQGWDKVRFFAYIFDEVDGDQDSGAAAGDGTAQAARFHHGMKQVQDALDAGAGGPGRIRLTWTSHADPARWAGTGADLRGTISWWVPNGHALNTEFFRPIASQPGQTVWFYHSGQPAIGNHTINQLGVDLRLWGLLCWRYQVQGSFWWSMMSFPKRYDKPDFNPYDHPSYKWEDTRWGNGTLFYPGARLTMIGARRNIAGPIPSLRMKAYRRGLQDYEYCWLTSQHGQGKDADALLKRLIPAAFSEASAGAVRGAWSQTPADYYQMRWELAKLIMTNNKGK